MPAFRLGDAGSAAIVAYIHDQKTKADTLGGGRRSVDVEDLATGNAGLATAISMERGLFGMPFP